MFQKYVGSGAYGKVIGVYDKEQKMNVAIKKIPNAFDNLTDAKRILREVRLLKLFDQKNILRLLSIFPFHVLPESYKDIYIVTELLETDLHKIICSPQPLSEEHIRHFLFQILVP